MASPVSSSEQTPRTEVSIINQASLEENCENLHSDGFAKEKIWNIKMSLKNQAFLEGNCGSSHSEDAQLKPLSGLENGQTPKHEISIESKTLLEENCKTSPSYNPQLMPLSLLGNEQIPESATPLRNQSLSEENQDSGNFQAVLVSDSVQCPQLDKVEGSDCIEKNAKEDTYLLGSAPKKSIMKDDQRTSKYHGVSRHFWTGKFEAHLWDNSFIREGHRRKGKQVFLGQYEIEEKAAQAYDLTALKYWGPSASTKLNFPISSYEKVLEEMNNMSREEFVTSIRRKSCFKRGSSIYRGVTRHGDGRWQARISGVPGKRGLHLGTFSSEEEAAKAYDIAAVKLRGMKAFTNFDIGKYCQEGSKDSEGGSQLKRQKKCVKLAVSKTPAAEMDPQPDLIITSP